MNTTNSPQCPGHGWHQVNLWCRDWQAAGHTALTRLAPPLRQAETGGLLMSWWFTRKNTCWRMRYRACPGQDEQVQAVIDETLRGLVDDGAIRRWTMSEYEPEIHAFGGTEGMDVAHTLFHADSDHLLDHLNRAGDRHRSELGVLHACALMRGAAQDWYEQGDIWAQTAAHRSADRSPTSMDIDGIHRLLTARAATVGAHTWTEAFRKAGVALADLVAEGRLTRGLRATLTHHVLFAWNRAGIPVSRQALLAQAAAAAIFHRNPAPVRTSSRPEADGQSLRLTEMKTTDATPEIEQLKAGLVDYIRTRGTFCTPAVEAAFTAVPRHLFLPGVDTKTAYAPQVVITKRAEDGSAVSSASHPNMVTSMLEQLDVRSGHRVLEIGTATGINAALLAELVGDSGAVSTVEIDKDLADGARTALAAAGYDNVDVVAADGAFGHPDRAPYDRIIVTAGACDIPAAWWEQLAPAGRMVVPLRLHDSGLTRSIALDRTALGRMVSVSAQVCGFIPLRGACDSSDSIGHSVQLADDVTLNLGTHEAGDTEALSNALVYPAHEVWPGITLDDADPVEHLDLWLATTTPHFARLSVEGETRQSGRVTPALRWAGAALHDGAGTLAYLTLRPRCEHTDELGLIAHGPDAVAFAARTVELLHRWNTERPTQPTITAYSADTPAEKLPDGTRITKPDTTLTIRWETNL